MFTFKTPYGKYENCSIVTAGSGKYTRYDIFDNEGPVHSINLPGYGKSDTIIALNHDCLEPTLNFLKKHHIIKRFITEIPSGFVYLKIIEIDKDKLKQL